MTRDTRKKLMQMALISAAEAIAERRRKRELAREYPNSHCPVNGEPLTEEDERLGQVTLGGEGG